MKNLKITLLIFTISLFCSTNVSANDFIWTKDSFDDIYNANKYTLYSYNIFNNNNLYVFGNGHSNGMQVWSSEDRGYTWNLVFGVLPFEVGSLYPDMFFTLWTRWGVSYSKVIKTPKNEFIACTFIYFYDDSTSKWIIHFAFISSTDFKNGDYSIRYVDNLTQYGSIYNYDFYDRTNGIVVIKDSLNNNYKLFITQDTMKTWNEVFNSKNKMELVAMNSENNICFVNYDASDSSNYLYKSIDKGENWDILDINFANIGYGKIAFADIKFFNENIGFLLGKSDSGNIIFKTTDGGDNWSEFLHTPLSKFYYLDVVSEDILAIYGNNASDAALFTFDGGKTWEATPDGVRANPFVIIDSTEILSFENATTLWRGKRYNSILSDFQTHASLYPNPTTSNSTITLELAEAAQVNITLCDILGREIKQIYNAFTDTGNFTQSFSTQELAKGVYYLRIHIDGEVKVEKVLVN
ncbi:MAG: T9SS type A sorting domain-containing protein [Ignavibacteria bacterium]|jgi:photosystem II stability/assembly factor-like uncharacterized protein|nr:T9SS type A sorting domain-containing protein [Ignavibacteria bacterium]